MSDLHQSDLHQSDLEFFFDPVCPWAWITSRWVVEVQHQRDYDVQWRFISLAVLNETLVADWYTDDYKAGHRAGLYALRVADAVRLSDGNDAVGRYYAALGTSVHNGRQNAALRTDIAGLVAAALAEAGADAALVAHIDDDSHDAHLRAETAVALSRTGPDVGTPIITFHPGQADEGSFFGPVINAVPRGAEASKLWDAIETLATTSGVSELKRSLRGKPTFD
jgi:2-hydroxychromene-2-carboxylate isomerase